MSAVRLVRRNAGPCNALPDLHPITQRVLAARGVSCADDLNHSLDGLHRYHTLNGIAAAVEILERALRERQRIVIVADFDADGATSCAVGMRALAAMGVTYVNYIVPNRFEYGYGLTPPIVDLAHEHNPDLLITVDNGISSIAGVSYARARGIDVLITDHHLPGDELPSATAIVNPNLRDDQFPSKNLAGVGVIFYVMLALRQQLRDSGWFDQAGIDVPNLAELLDLVALGTVADVVPLDHNNRRLVAQGLSRIRAGRAKPGIAALLNIGGRDYTRATTTDLAYAAAPRLNAAGRLSDMSLGIECLLTDVRDTAERAARELDQLNRERRDIESEMKEQALSLVAELMPESVRDLPMGLCLRNESWHQGVVGIVASRVKDRFHRPVIAFAPVGDGELKGSGRSVKGIHMRDALDAIAARHPGLLSKFGGHAMAAGLTIDAALFPQFEQAFANEVERVVGAEGLDPKIYTDGELNDADFTLELAEELSNAAPWGQGFPEPLFDGTFLVVEHRLVGNNHLRLRLQPVNGERAVNAIAFGLADELSVSAGITISIAYRLSVNEYRGDRSLQLVVDHAELADTNSIDD